MITVASSSRAAIRAELSGLWLTEVVKLMWTRRFWPQLEQITRKEN